jgi:hypothetical protein
MCWLARCATCTQFKQIAGWLNKPKKFIPAALLLLSRFWALVGNTSTCFHTREYVDDKGISDGLERCAMWHEDEARAHSATVANKKKAVKKADIFFLFEAVSISRHEFVSSPGVA